MTEEDWEFPIDVSLPSFTLKGLVNREGHAFSISVVHKIVRAA